MLNQRSSLRPFWTSMLSRVYLTWTSGWPCEMQLVQNRSTSAMPVEVMRCHNFWGKKLQLWSVKSANMKHYETIGFEHSANTFGETGVGKVEPGSSCRKWHLRDWWSDKSKSWRNLPCSSQAAKSNKKHHFGDSDGKISNPWVNTFVCSCFFSGLQSSQNFRLFEVNPP